MNNMPMNPMGGMGGGIGGGFGGPTRGNGFMDRWRLSNHQKASALRAKIAENNRIESEEMVKTTIVWGTAQDKFEEERETIKATVAHRWAIAEKAQGETQTILMKNQGIGEENKRQMFLTLPCT